MQRNSRLAMIMIAAFLIVLAFSGSAFAADETKVDFHHLLLRTGSNGSLHVTEIIKFNNSDRASVEVPLPTGYQGLKVSGLNTGSYTAGPDALVTNVPLNPGTTEVTLTYDLPFTNGSLKFSKTFKYPTEVFYVLSQKGEFRITGSGIQDMGIQSLEGNDLHVLGLNQAIPGSSFTLDITPDLVNQGYRPSGAGFHSASHLQRWFSSPLANTNPHLWVAGIALLFFGSVALISLQLRKKHREQQLQKEAEKMAGLLDNLVLRQKRLLDKIAALDSKKEAGNISIDEHADLRKQYVSTLVKIKLKIKELEALEEIQG